MKLSKHIVFVLPRHPWPAYAGQSRLAFNRARELQKRGYSLSLFSFSFHSLKVHEFRELSKSFHRIYHYKIPKPLIVFAVFSGLAKSLYLGTSLQIELFGSFFIRNKFIRFLTAYSNKSTVIHFYSIRSSFLWQTAEYYQFKQVRDLVDSMTLNIMRKLKIKSSPFTNVIWKYELKAITKFEQNLSKTSFTNAYICVSSNDLSYLHTGSVKKVANGVGVDLVSENPRNIGNIYTYKLLFFGSLFYEPNQSAINWIINKINPLLSELPFNYSITFAGSHPPDWLFKLCSDSDKLNLIANPSDMSSVLSNHHLVLAPMVSGSGQQFKIIESLAQGIPVITTSLGAEPFNLENNKHCIIEDDPNVFAQKIIDLLNDNSLYSYISEQGIKLAQDSYMWPSLSKSLSESGVYSL